MSILDKILAFLGNGGEPVVEKVPNGLVIAIGIGTVFVGLIAIVLICKIVGLILNPKKDNAEVVTASEPVAAPAVNTATTVTENRAEILAAVCAVAAEELGTEIEAIRVHSFKKL